MTWFLAGLNSKCTNTRQTIDGVKYWRSNFLKSCLFYLHFEFACALILGMKSESRKTHFLLLHFFYNATFNKVISYCFQIIIACFLKFKKCIFLSFTISIDSLQRTTIASILLRICREGLARFYIFAVAANFRGIKVARTTETARFLWGYSIPKKIDVQTLLDNQGGDHKWVWTLIFSQNRGTT